MGKKNRDPEDGMADAARGMSTGDLVRSKNDLNEKASRGGELTNSERRKADILDRELAQRPLAERAWEGAKDAVRRRMGDQESLEDHELFERPEWPSTVKCVVCAGSGALDRDWCSGPCPACGGNGTIKVPKGPLRRPDPLPDEPQWRLDPLEPVHEPGASIGRPTPGGLEAEAEAAPEGGMSAKSIKLVGTSAKTAKATSRPATVEGTVQGGKAAYYKLQAKAGEEIKFTIYARQQQDGNGVNCSFALQDEEGGKLDGTSMYVTATGEDFDRESLTAEVDEDGTYLFRFRSEGEGAVVFKIKVK